MAIFRSLPRAAFSLITACLLLISPIAAQEISDGPYLFHQDNGQVEAVWVENGTRASQTFSKGEAIELPQFAHLLGDSLELQSSHPSPGIYKAPKKLLAITDVEGQYDSMFAFLLANEVIDKNGKWNYGKGHLVTIGDMVDRGDQVTEVLWMLYRLGHEAEAAGGKVHFIIGNHEAMVLGGDTRYIAEKYETSCDVLGMTYEDLLGADTVLGQWLRSCNSIVAIGPTIFVHAGISPQLPVARKQIDAVNQAIRENLGTPKSELREENMPAADLIWGRQGPLWYRGYFASPGYGPRPLGEEVTAILQQLQADMMVIGHTQVDSPCFFYEPQQVLALDVSWTKPDEVRGLVIEGKKMTLVDIKGTVEPLLREPALRVK